jgi:hypothetical protein
VYPIPIINSYHFTRLIIIQLRLLLGSMGLHLLLLLHFQVVLLHFLEETRPGYVNGELTSEVPSTIAPLQGGPGIMIRHHYIYPIVFMCYSYNFSNINSINRWRRKSLFVLYKYSHLCKEIFKSCWYHCKQ